MKDPKTTGKPRNTDTAKTSRSPSPRKEILREAERGPAKSIDVTARVPEPDSKPRKK